MPKFCPTRWTARVSTLSALLDDILKALERIKENSTGDGRVDAASYIRLMKDSQFVVALVVGQFVLSFLARVTVVLQSKDCNLIDAFTDVALTKECIRDTRNEECWAKVWKRSEQLASTIGITMQKSRTVQIQSHRANAGAVNQSSCDYYRINVYYPFIDHVIQELDTRFSNEHEGLIAAQYLIPFF